MTMTEKTIVYSSLGRDMHVFQVDTGSGALTPIQTFALPADIQDAWPNLARTLLYVATSDAGPMSLVKRQAHFIQALKILPTGELAPHGEPMPLGNRPLSITLDGAERHALLAYSTPSNITVHAIRADGSVGDEVTQQPIQFGSTVHQVRVTPAGNIVVTPECGHHPTGEAPGAIGIYSYANGRMAPLARIEADPARAAPWLGKKIGAHGFAARHVDFHPTRPWMYLCVERQGELHLYDCDDKGIAPRPRAIKSTLEGVTPGPSIQMAASIHVHPNGRFVYITNRARDTEPAGDQQVFMGGVNDVAVFEIDPDTGVPTLIQHIDAQGNFPRTFGIDARGKVLVVGNQDHMLVRTDGGIRKILPGLAVFAIGGDGKLTLLNRMDHPDNGQVCFWTSVVTLGA